MAVYVRSGDPQRTVFHRMVQGHQERSGERAPASLGSSVETSSAAMDDHRRCGHRLDLLQTVGVMCSGHNRHITTRSQEATITVITARLDCVLMHRGLRRWLIEHGIPKGKKDGQLIMHYLIYTTQGGKSGGAATTIHW